MTQHIINALRTAAKLIRADYSQAHKRYARLDRKSRKGNGLNFDESEAHDFEDGFTTALTAALAHLARELSAVGIVI